MTREEYQRYLASRDWALLKEQVRQRSGGICERCHRSRHEQTHHLTYERLGHERLDDLLGVCAPCHEYESGKSDIDPARCALFVAGPVPDEPLTGWQTDLVPYLTHYDLVIPMRRSSHVGGDFLHGVEIGQPHGDSIMPWTPSDVVASNAAAIRRACGVIAYLDHGNRVGTVVDLTVAATARKPIVLLDRSPFIGRNSLWHDNDDKSYPLTEAWYLVAFLHQSNVPLSVLPRNRSLGGFWGPCAEPHSSPKDWDTLPSVRRITSPPSPTVVREPVRRANA